MNPEISVVILCYRAEEDARTFVERVINNLNPVMTFTTLPTATAARQAIMDEYLPDELPNITPPMAYQGFYIPYEATATHFSHVFAGDKYDDNEWQSWDLNEFTGVGRNDSVVVAIAEFALVPEPGGLVMLLGVGAGVMLVRRKRG